MEMISTLVEAVVMSFLVGAILGGVVVAHLLVKSQPEEESNLQPVKIKVDRNDR